MDWFKHNWLKAVSTLIAVIATVAIVYANVKVNTSDIKELQEFKETQIAVNSIMVTELKNISKTLTKIEQRMDK